jgi:hypothetical protein
VKERVEKQLVRALMPIVKAAAEVERLTLIDAQEPNSRIVVLTLKSKPALTELLKDVGDSMLKPLTLNTMSAMRLTTSTGQVRHIVEVSAGTFIISDGSVDRLTAHFDLAAKVKRPTGVVAMARNFPGGYIGTVRASALADIGAAAGSTLTTAPLVAVDFQPLPTATVILPVDGQLRDELIADWTPKSEDMANKLIALGTATDVRIGKGKSALQIQATISASTLLDDIWRRQFNDFDLKFRPLGLALDF